MNSLRVGWTQEDVAFANPCFTGNGRDLTLCEPTLAFQTFTDQQDNTAQARVNDAYQVEDTFSWFLPNKHGDHDVKFGAQFEFVNADNVNQGNMNSTFSFGTSNGPFNAADPRTYPDRLTVRVAGSVLLRREGVLLVLLRAGQVEDGQPPDRDDWRPL